MRFHWMACIALLCLAGTSAVAHAEVQTKEITYSHDGQSLKGVLAWDSSIKTPRPGVLVVHEWWGLNEYARTRAIKLAELGYVAFAVDMYGDGKVTDHPKQAGEWASMIRGNTEKWQQRALAGLNVLKEQPGVDASRLAAIGYCFGGSTVLQLAFTGAPVKGVVSFHGALVSPPEGTKLASKVLICHGGADPFIPAAAVDAFAVSMDQIKADYVINVFGGAKHGFTNPGAGNYGLEALAYDANADARSWKYMQVFFDEIFGKK